MTRLNLEQAKALGIAHLWPKGIPMKTPAPPSDGMNKLERAFWERAREEFGDNVYREPFKLRLAGRTYYTPDFLVADAGLYDVYEIKGFMRDDASCKLKVAAETFPCFQFILVTRIKRRWECRLVTNRGISPHPHTPEWLA
jgi:Uncharacterized conserved protein